MEENDEGGGGHDSSERWLVSYADFITLLFALFVLLYALSMQSSEQVNRAWTAMATGVGARPHMGGTRPELGETASGGPAGEAVKYQQLQQVASNITAQLKKFTNPGVSIKVDEHGVVLSLSAARFFDSGDSEINPEQLLVLDTVVSSIALIPNRMEIDGFTDSVPISTARFHDNWELSAARSASVLRYALEHSRIGPDQMTIAGYGPYKPVADNASEEGRSRNRRVEIRILPEENL